MRRGGIAEVSLSPWCDMEAETRRDRHSEEIEGLVGVARAVRRSLIDQVGEQVKKLIC